MTKPVNDDFERLPLRYLRHDDPSRLSERELPEWLQLQHETQREREATDRAKIGIAALVILLSGLTAITAIYNYAGAA